MAYGLGRIAIGRTSVIGLGFASFGEKYVDV